MPDSIIDFFSGTLSELYVFIISMLPLVELRGAIPVGVGLNIPFYLNFPFAVMGNMLPIPFILLFIPRILDFLARFKIFRPIVEWLRKKANKYRKKIIKNAESESHEISHDETVRKDSGDEENSASDGESLEAINGSCIENEVECSTLNSDGALLGEAKMTISIFVALLLFVALPIPGTGAWTGALVAALFGLSKKYSMLAIFLGVLICGVIMCLASYGVLGFLSFLL